MRITDAAVKKSFVSVSAVLSVSLLLNGCSVINAVNREPVVLSVSEWPDETRVNELKRLESAKKKFEEENPNIEIVRDRYIFNNQTFKKKAVDNQLPNLYKTYFTEIKDIISNGYAANITQQVKENGMLKDVSRNVLDVITDENGEVYAVPIDSYAMGLCINRNIFKDAGLIDDVGNVKIPDTYEEIAEYGKIIKEKTGKAGFVLATSGYSGGWKFMNIAWSYGVKFMSMQGDGKYVASFDTQEMCNALKYIYDLKWTYDILPEEFLIDGSEENKIFGTGQAAMILSSPPLDEATMRYGMNPQNMVAARIPKGPEGRYSLMGGNVYMFSNESTPDQIEAGLKWITYIGNGAELNENNIEQKEDELRDTIFDGGMVLPEEIFPVWTNPNRTSMIKVLREKYANIEQESYSDYKSFKDVTIKAEEPKCSQQLYAVLDKCIQEVISNKDADIPQIVKKANDEFQAEYLSYED